MKKIFLLFVSILGVLSASAQQTRVDSHGNQVHHPFFAVAQYQIRDFAVAKESGAYGLGLVFSSLSHWGIFHVGADVNFSINAGLIDPWGCIIDFGPSARIDINKNFFVNIPVNAVCNVAFPEGSTDTETEWGAKISPAIHGFFTDRFGLFAGPQVYIASGGTHFGMEAGVSYTF